jgi:hypothetical protein
MSHIPNSAMPHAGGPKEHDPSGPAGTEEMKQDSRASGKQDSGASRSRAGKIADKARDNPKTAVAAGAAIVGAIAAAAIPAVLAARKKSSDTKEAGGSKKGGGAKKSSSSGKSGGSTKSGGSSTSS